MWPKLKEQLPAILLTIVLIGGLAYWLHTETVRQMASTQEAEMLALREQTQAELRDAAAETRQQIDEMNAFLRDAIKSRSSDLLLSDEEYATAQRARVEQLADAIADRVQATLPLPKTADEAIAREDMHVARVSDQLTDRLKPLIAQLSDDQAANRQILENISAEITNQLSVVLTSELAKNQTLNNNLGESQAIARDSIGLAQELAALYLSSFEDKGVLTRILTLPAGLIKDASQASFVNSSERKKKEEELFAKLAEFQTRLEALQAKAPPGTDE